MWYKEWMVQFQKHFDAKYSLKDSLCSPVVHKCTASWNGMEPFGGSSLNVYVRHCVFAVWEDFIFIPK